LLLHYWDIDKEIATFVRFISLEDEIRSFSPLPREEEKQLPELLLDDLNVYVVTHNRIYHTFISNSDHFCPFLVHDREHLHTAGGGVLCLRRKILFGIRFSDDLILSIEKYLC